jgi:peptidoglycan/xylan/chitin deacetylase (PgdA/CDA1 family)
MNTTCRPFIILIRLLLPFFELISGCNSGSDRKTRNDSLVIKQPADSSTRSVKISDPAVIMKRKQVPVLCYHHIRDWKVTDSKRARDYIVPLDTFYNQMKLLADSGYHTISPDQLYRYLAAGESIPAKSILLTFDDSDEEQYTIAKTEMDKYRFKGVFFIMTVSLGRPNYMTREQVKQLSDEGHTIGSHTWDHKNIKKYIEADWPIQIERPTKLLQNITGKPIYYFAYPFGLWDTAAISGLQKRGMMAAFQLSDFRDPERPLFTIRRIIVPGYWSTRVFAKRIKTSF